MRILIDLQAAQTESSSTRGIGRYSAALVTHLLKESRQHEFYVLLNNRFERTTAKIKLELSQILPESNIILLNIPESASFISDHNGSKQRVMTVIRESLIDDLRPDHIIICSLFEGFNEDAIVSANSAFHRIPTSVVFYDLIPLIFSDIYLSNDQVRAFYHQKLTSLKRADLLLAISESSRSDAITYLNRDPQTVVCISSASDEMFAERCVDQARITCLRQRYDISKEFILYQGGNDFRKNITGLIKAYAQLPIDVRCIRQLVIVCSITDLAREEYLNQALSCGLEADEVQFTGYISDEDLIDLYNICSLFVFPSIYEGFGLPVLEAMRCGAPVICSNTSSMPEIVANIESTFDPNNIASISAKMLEATVDEQFVSRLRENSRRRAGRFSWQLVAQSTIKAIERFHEGINAPTANEPKSSMQKTLALISPFPPLQSGISNYSKELAAGLEQHYNIHLISCQDKIENSSLTDLFPIYSVEHFKEHFLLYDRVIYQVGNSEYHAHMLALIRDYPGIVVLHDLFLSGLMLWLNRTSSAVFEQTLAYSHGVSALHYLSENGYEAALWKYPMNKEIVDYAMGIIVHSDFSRNALLASGANQSEVVRIPHLRRNVHIDREKARKELGIDDDEILICSFGMIGSTKLNHEAAKAFNLINATGRKLSLYFVGPAPDGLYVNELKKIIDRSVNKIIITGFVDELAYEQYLGAADLALQLRTRTRGETSGAVLDCMAYGLPTIVNEEGPLREYPDSCLMKLPASTDEDNIASALNKMVSDSALRAEMGRTARQHVSTCHAPFQVCEHYVDFVENIYETGDVAKFSKVGRQILARIAGEKNRDQLVNFAARAAALNFRKGGLPRLLIDVSELARRYREGNLDEIVCKTALEFIRAPKVAHRAELIYMDKMGEEIVFRSANRLTERLLALEAPGCLGNEAIVDVAPGDIYLSLDYFPRGVSAGVDRGVFARMRNEGVLVVFADLGFYPVIGGTPKSVGGFADYYGWLVAVTRAADLLIHNPSFFGKDITAVGLSGNPEHFGSAEVWHSPYKFRRERDYYCEDHVVSPHGNDMRADWRTLLDQSSENADRIADIIRCKLESRASAAAE
ncbi:Glycosyltransferase involved in cell wall bisynthesis [Methylobacterium sp. 190mf]|uniref:glycosyltransferase n=1 Tax=Methylobacterium sp. 190mf TaxID=1761798 RepID=UPI00089E67FB|nr:glycosyltransferase [Methylobacterium sp. 190mf]SEG72891.1 Glycosyltransferase involved in cell wall bisynthesis [Methylobacterium sp. 190mf]